jgi:hypothetical protein
MKFNLTYPIQYSELKAWFNDNKDNLPKQLKVTGRNYTNVSLIIETNTERFESQLKASKDNIRISELAKATHRVLTTLYNDLKQTT